MTDETQELFGSELHAKLDAAVEIVELMTGRDLEWTSIARTVYGGFCVYVADRVREKFGGFKCLLLERPAGTFELYKDGIMSQDKFLATTRAELERTDASFGLSLSIKDRDRFEKVILIGNDSPDTKETRTIEDISEEDFISNFFTPHCDDSIFSVLEHHENWDTIFENLHCSDIEFDGSRLNVRVSADIKDRKAMIAATQKCTEISHGDRSWFRCPESISDALFEIMFNSSAGPSAESLGYEVAGIDRYRPDPE